MIRAETPMTDEETRPPADDGPTETPSGGGGKTHRYRVHVVWEGDGSGCGTVEDHDGNTRIPVASARNLGGCGKGANPEELLLSAVGACFIATWAIFLKKLSVQYSEPSIRVAGDLGKDPAGGYRMESISIVARVPAELLKEREADVRKTLELAERYCIISKVAKAAMPVRVELETV
jgi:peroxiredoxin-like protein